MYLEFLSLRDKNLSLNHPLIVTPHIISYDVDWRK